MVKTITQEQVIEVVADLCQDIPRDRIGIDSRLEEDLGCDSLDRLGIILGIEELGLTLPPYIAQSAENIRQLYNRLRLHPNYSKGHEILPGMTSKNPSWVNQLCLSLYAG